VLGSSAQRWGVGQVEISSYDESPNRVIPFTRDRVALALGIDRLAPGGNIGRDPAVGQMANETSERQLKAPRGRNLATIVPRLNLEHAY
jgi:hypothetical protein